MHQSTKTGYVMIKLKTRLVFKTKNQQSIFRWTTYLFVALIIGTLAAATSQAQDLTAKEKRSVKSLRQQINRAANSFKTKRYSSSADAIKRAMVKFDELASGARTELLTEIEKDYARMKKAHELLIAQGETLPAFSAMPMAASGTFISFKETVAPILIAKCGNCHVNQSRGDFSAASFTALVDSTMVAFGKPDDSRLIEVIENGEMPKGGLKVSADELKSLKDWIAQGAKFDGDEEAQNLRELTGAAAPPRRQRMNVAKPTGKETVSFGLDIAPVLIEQCADCHIRRNPRGNYSMANFRSFLRGGDGGSPVQPGDLMSALVKRLHGDGAEQMPPDRKLDAKVIAKFEMWIKEDATFDGGDPQLDLPTVAATVRASALSHEDLLADRKVQTAATWKLAMGDVKSKTAASENFIVAAAAKDERLDDVVTVCEQMASKVASTLKLGKKDRLVKGNMSIFVMSKRYDFSEFGRMVEKREFAKEISSHWNYDTINAYGAVLMTRNQSADDVSVELTKQIASLHIASQAADVPRWFANGMGLWTAKRIHTRHDSFKDLDKDAELAAAGMSRLDDFVQNRLPGDKAALVAYLFVKQLKTGSSSSFNKLMKGLQGGQTFEKAFSSAFGVTAQEMLQKLSQRQRR